VIDAGQLGYSWLTPVLGCGVALLGGLLGSLLAAKARVTTGRARRRLLAYACLVLGGVAAWQSGAIGLSGITVAAASVRYDPAVLAQGLIAGVALIGAGLAVACTPAVRVWRVGTGGLLLGLGLAAIVYLNLGAVRVPGSVSYSPLRLLPVGLAGALTASLLLWSMLAARYLASVAAAAAGFATSLAITWWLAIDAIQVRLDADGPPLRGVTQLQLLMTMMLLAAMSLTMIAFFTLGTATLRDLRLVPRGIDASHSIEPWLMAEVASRVARTGVDEQWLAEQQTVDLHRYRRAASQHG
jgi:NO-binding membrane sensor protein with MHYT domain